MPMGCDNVWYGNNADGTKSSDYCLHCWQDGTFTAPNLTMEQMVEICVPHMVADPKMGFTEESARGLMYEMLPKLKRWKEKSEE